ncbi:MAG: hypothetical protein H8D97_00315 [Proteobacteria bacterium]|nr:hypothetical protein [Pseudomonadota bacterium]
MWTILHKNRLNDFLNNHSELNNYDNEFILREMDQYYILPRLFASTYNSPYLGIHEDNTFNGETIDIEFSGKLRSYQQEGAEQLKLLWDYNGEVNGLVKAHPGLS